MLEFWNLLEEGLYMNIENVLLLLFSLGAIIFAAVDSKIGLIIELLTTTVLFIIFYSLGWSWWQSLVSMFITFILLCFSLYAVSKVESKGGII